MSKSMLVERLKEAEDRLLFCVKQPDEVEAKLVRAKIKLAHSDYVNLELTVSFSISKCKATHLCLHNLLAECNVIEKYANCLTVVLRTIKGIIQQISRETFHKVLDMSLNFSSYAQLVHCQKKKHLTPMI